MHCVGLPLGTYRIQPNLVRLTDPLVRGRQTAPLGRSGQVDEASARATPLYPAAVAGRLVAYELGKHAPHVS